MANKFLDFFMKEETQNNLHECPGCGRKYENFEKANECFKTHDCCIVKKDKKKGVINGIAYGLVPHTFCILFIVASIVGATTATTLFKPLLMSKNFFYWLITLSFIFATLSVLFYLKRNNCLCWTGAGKRWKYLSIMYSTTIAINLLFFFVIFPAVANISLVEASSPVKLSDYPLITLDVNIPCSGHAPLIIGELKKAEGVLDAKYLSGKFDVTYDPNLTSKDQILAISIFKDFPAKIVSENSPRSLSQASESPTIGKAQEAVQDNGFQEINMNVDSNGFTPNVFVIKKGVPLKWNINAIQLNGCNSEIIVKDYGKEVRLNPGKNTIELTPSNDGTVQWSCGMGMLRGTFIVTETGKADQSQISSVSSSIPKSGSCGCGGGK